MRLLAAIALIALAGCGPMRPLTEEDRAYLRQMQLDQQRANNAALQQQMQTMNSRAAYQSPPPTQAPSLQAYWTGRSEIAQSVTGASGFNCEYSYAGKKFWRMFGSSCPGSVDVR